MVRLPTLPCALLLCAALAHSEAAWSQDTVTNKERDLVAFEPASAQVRSDGRIARCNTVHSLALPQSVLHRYGFVADVNTAILSCSLQTQDDIPVNLPARIAGTATTLTGKTSELDFKEILDHSQISYVAAFDLTARSELRFDVTLTDARTARRHNVQLRQVELPGRR